MALEFMKIPGLQKILTSLDFKSYLIGVDKLPDYRDASYCTYDITEDAEARAGKIYYDRVPLAKGGYAYNPCSHTKLSVVDHLMSIKPYEFCKIQPDAFLVAGKNGPEAGASTIYQYCTIDSDGSIKTVILSGEHSNVVIDNDKYRYYYRNESTKELVPLSFLQTTSGTMIRARRNFYGKDASGNVEPGGLPAPAGSTYWYLATSGSTTTWTALPNTLVGSVAEYEASTGRTVYLRVKSDSSNKLGILALYNCGWYFGHVRSDTIYNVDLKMGALTEYNISEGASMAGRALSYTNDTVFVKDKVYYIRKANPVLSEVSMLNVTSELTVTLYNVNWLFSNFVVLSKSDPELGYGGYASVAKWKEDHEGYDLYEESSTLWIQPDGFLGTLTRNHNWYERVGDRFPYAGFVAIATSKYNGQQIGGFYHARMRQYQLTEDTVHHFRWLDEDHTQAQSKTYYEWNSATNVYTARDGSPGNLIYREVDGTDYFQKPMTSVFVDGETYYSYNKSTYTEISDWVPGDPIPNNVFVANRPVYYRNGWNITPVEVRYGVTTDETPVAGKNYYVYSGDSFMLVTDDNFFTVTTDTHFTQAKADSNAYYYCDRDNTSKTGLSKFVVFDASSYVGKHVNSQSRIIYEKNKAGAIPTEVQFCVPFGKYNGMFDGVAIPNDIDVVVESLNGEPILRDAYYEACKGMYVWEQYFIERGTSVTKPYNVQAIYVTSGSKVTLNLMWTDPKFMLHKDDPTMAPDVWAKTDVDLEYYKEVGGALIKKTVRLVTEVGTNDVYADNFFTVDGSTATDFSGQPIDAAEFSNAVATGTIRITATAATGINSEYAVRPSKVVWVNSSKSFVSLLGGTAVPGVRYYTINADGKETELADVAPYVTDVSSDKIYIKYQKEIETYVDDGGTKNLIIIGTTDHKDGAIVPSEDISLYTRITENPEITIRELVRAGLFDKLFTAASGGFNITGALLGQVPLRLTGGSTYGQVNVTVVDSDGVSLGYNIGQGYEDVLKGVTADHITLNPNTVYYAKQSTTDKECNSDEADVNNVYYEFARVVDITKYFEDASGTFSNTDGNKGVLFTRTNLLPHYKHYINSKNVPVRGSTDLFEVGVTYNVRKAGVVEFVTLHPDFRGPDHSDPDVTGVQYYYYRGIGKGTTGIQNQWDEVPMKDPSLQPVKNSARYLAIPVNGKGRVVTRLTTGTFDDSSNYYHRSVVNNTYGAPVLMVRGTDYNTGDSISAQASVTNYIYVESIVDIDTDDTDFNFRAGWKYGNSTGSSDYGLYTFTGWKFYYDRKYYIHYDDVEDGGMAEYHIGDNVLAWTNSHSGTVVYVERPGVSQFLDVTGFGYDALRACTVPLYIKDKGMIDHHDGRGLIKDDIYVPIDRPIHSATFRYQYPLSTQCAFGCIAGATVNNTYWDNSLARKTLQEFGEPNASLGGDYEDYVEFYENHIIPVISTTFKNWSGDKYDTSRVFDKFWLPCLGSFVRDELFDDVNNENIVGVPSEDGGLDLYSKGIGQARHSDAMYMARKVQTSPSNGAYVNWLLRTCPKYKSGGTPVVVAIDNNGNIVTKTKSTAAYLVPHFTIA